MSFACYRSVVAASSGDINMASTVGLSLKPMDIISEWSSNYCILMWHTFKRHHNYLLTSPGVAKIYVDHRLWQ